MKKDNSFEVANKKTMKKLKMLREVILKSYLIDKENKGKDIKK